MFIVSKALLISSAFLRCCLLCVVPSLKSVEFCTRVAWVCLLLCKEEGSSLVPAITERRDMGLYDEPVSMSLLGFGMGTMFANFHMCGIMLVLRAVFSMLVRNASPRGPMCFRCLMFSLSALYELLFLLCFLFYCLMELNCGKCDVISFYFMCFSGFLRICLSCVLRV